MHNTVGGVVTFLDVLGWKGVYHRKHDAIDSLRYVIEVCYEKKVPEFTRGSDVFRNPSVGVEIKSISDTIAIFTRCEDFHASAVIEIHGLLCAWLIIQSIIREIPLRGATAFGDFDINENIFLGRAVDEAAAWHEQSDWIGVHLTPSAEYVFEVERPDSVWTPYRPPNKIRLDWTPHCANWVKGWLDQPYSEDDLKSHFRRLGPILPEVAGKFINTLLFFREMSAK